MKYLREFIKKTIYNHLIEQKNIENNFNNNFWKWFGSSKVVDGQKNPLVVYHGTDVDFKSFSKDKIGYRHWQSKSNAYGGGFFFTDKEYYAQPKDIVKKVYLKIENPLITKAGDYYYATDMYDNNSESFLQYAKEDGNDGIIIKTTSGSLYIAFEPNQIKSIENDGTWDIEDNNIFS